VLPQLALLSLNLIDYVYVVMICRKSWLNVRMVGRSDRDMKVNGGGFTNLSPRQAAEKLGDLAPLVAATLPVF